MKNFFKLLFMVTLTLLVIHCTATPEGREITKNQLVQMHTAAPPIGQGWSQVGYSDMIHLDGRLENLVAYNEDQIVDRWEITNGVVGLNHKARHVVYVGGLAKDNKTPLDTRTFPQKEALKTYILNFLKLHPNAQIAGHNQFANKACPSFNTGIWLKQIGVSNKNIYTKA